MEKIISIYSLVATSRTLTTTMTDATKNVRDLYPQLQGGIPMVVTAREKPIHSESINLPGHGERYSGVITPHVTLLHYVDAQNRSAQYIQTVRDVLTPGPLALDRAGTYFRVSDEGIHYTCYLKYAQTPEWADVRKRIVTASQGYMSEKTYSEYLSIAYFPHSTILYDDSTETSVLEAEKRFPAEARHGVDVFDHLVLEQTTLYKDGTIAVDVIDEIALG